MVDLETVELLLLPISWSLAFAAVRANFEATRKVKGRL